MFGIETNATFSEEILLIHCVMMSSGDQSVPMIIGGDSTVTAQILSKILAPLSVPLVSPDSMMLIRVYVRSKYLYLCFLCFR